VISRCPFCHSTELPPTQQVTCLTCRAVLHAECALSQGACSACGGDVFAPAELRRVHHETWEPAHVAGIPLALIRHQARSTLPLAPGVRLGLDLLHLERTPSGLLAGSVHLELPQDARLGELRLELVEPAPGWLHSQRTHASLVLHSGRTRWRRHGPWASGTYSLGFRLVLPDLAPTLDAPGSKPRRYAVRVVLERPRQNLHTQLELRVA
jgi:hypothetical protein